MEKIILNDGTVLEDSRVNESNGKLWFYVMNGMNIRQVFALMSDPEKTERIRMVRGEAGETVYEGYTNILNIMRDAWQVSGGIEKG